ncbi:hypothetical protein [Bradyrhizobium sp. SZCCHNR1022]|uniref:hypothetical protein n=1 Tax=Bradyrhizobium sp. SZCCHNR1022 TaxID=3057345 RepID=UPI00291623D9|nr:hypothetical protein [Bradyrhizobium sp. SZCCHNR1022]
MRTLGRKAGRAGLLCGVVLFQVAVGVSLARSAEPGGSSPSAGEVAKDQGKESGPFGGCEPIGLTASGELVFPLECKKLIKKPAEAPVAEDKTPADDKTASVNPAPSVPSQAASADISAGPEVKPAAAAEAVATTPAASAEPKQAAVADKQDAAQKVAVAEPAAGKPSLTKPSVKSPSALAPATKPPSARSSSSKPSSSKPSSAQPSSAKPSSAKTAAANPPGTTPSPAGASSGKPSSGKAAQAQAVVVAARDAAVKDAGRTSRMVASRPMIVIARPATATTASARLQAEGRPRLRTAGLPACVQFRSYNPATHSYRGFDGHIYACR